MLEVELGDELRTGMSYGQLGNLAREQGDKQAAETWHRRALEIFERLEAPEEAEKARRLLQEIRADS